MRSFRSSRIVKEAWDVTSECARALRARMVLFQCPASFLPTKANIENMRKFFRKLKRDGLSFCWEPRGEWPREVVKDLCDELDLWHVVDPPGPAVTLRGVISGCMGVKVGGTSMRMGSRELYSLCRREESYVF